MKGPFLMYPLYALLLFLGISGTFGGGMLILQPDGSLLGMAPDWLEKSPFNSYFIPGFILFALIGLLPLLTFVGLLLKPDWTWANLFNIYSNRYWAWTYSLYSGFILIIWITVQLIMTQYFWLQPVMIFTGILILILTLTPPVMKKFEIH
jgi:hypothetical protein